jgi:hypothetical protein
MSERTRPERPASQSVRATTERYHDAPHTQRREPDAHDARGCPATAHA